jgi:hypothetical protein
MDNFCGFLGAGMISSKHGAKGEAPRGAAMGELALTTGAGRAQRDRVTDPHFKIGLELGEMGKLTMVD